MLQRRKKPAAGRGGENNSASANTYTAALPPQVRTVLAKAGVTERDLADPKTAEFIMKWLQATMGQHTNAASKYTLMPIAQAGGASGPSRTFSRHNLCSHVGFDLDIFSAMSMSSSQTISSPSPMSSPTPGGPRPPAVRSHSLSFLLLTLYVSLVPGLHPHQALHAHLPLQQQPVRPHHRLRRRLLRRHRLRQLRA